jgi:RNA polymerase sigma-70 factor (ECF subfamily)
MNILHESDETIMEKVADGDYEAMEHLVKRYANPLMTFIRRMAGSRYCGEDLFQEVFLTIWKKRTYYKHPQPFKLWLFRIAVNLYRAQIRIRSSRFFSLGDIEWFEPMLKDDPLPEDKAIAVETGRMVEEAVKILPAKQRAVVVLRIWNG